ncbi:MAG: hypothetical protein Q8867_08055 [Bacteroidota bacterium]|nr:hypothetical protein [Bacteroidota bacterium]
MTKVIHENKKITNRIFFNPSRVDIYHVTHYPTIIDPLRGSVEFG